jgi:glycosyltransferase involved in cell wall biosynthesis
MNKINQYKPNKILIFHRPSGYGGAEVYLINLVRTIVNDGMDVSICFGFDGFIPDGFDKNLINIGASIINIDFDPVCQTGISNLIKIWTWLKKNNPDVVLFNRLAFFESYSNAIIVSRINKCRVITVQHMDPPKWPKYQPRKYPPKNLHIIDLFQKIRFRFFANKIDSIICVNKAACERYIEEYGVHKDIIHLIYHGIDINKYEFDGRLRIEWRDKLGLNNHDILITAVSRHSLEKGIDILVESIALLPPIQKKKIIVALVGNGSEHLALKQLAIKLKVIDQIKFLGERSDIPQLLWASDIFVCPSRQESFGLAIAEAMAAGRCVIAAKVGGIPELLEDCGILVPPESPYELSQAISSVIDNAGLRIKYGKKAFVRVSKYFDITQSMRETMNVIKKVPD